MVDAFEHDGARDDELVLVDLCDRQVGVATKERVHRDGLLHRAFSVMLWREREGHVELLLARRAAGKYHSGGLWANSCCSHPRAGEPLADAVRRRVLEELGVDAPEPRELGSFVYRAVLGEVTEYELDHVYAVRCEDEVRPDPMEASDARWVMAEWAGAALTERPQDFCAWVPNVLALTLATLDSPRPQA